MPSITYDITPTTNQVVLVNVQVPRYLHGQCLCSTIYIFTKQRYSGARLIVYTQPNNDGSGFGQIMSYESSLNTRVHISLWTPQPSANDLRTSIGRVNREILRGQAPMHTYWDRSMLFEKLNVMAIHWNTSHDEFTHPTSQLFQRYYGLRNFHEFVASICEPADHVHSLAEWAELNSL